MEGSDGQKRAAFREAATILRRRIELLVSLPAEKLDRMSAKRQLTELGRWMGREKDLSAT